MPFAYANKLRIYFSRRGSGHPVLLISGLGYGGWLWHLVAPLLTERYQVIVPDPRGSGETGLGYGSYSVAALAQDMAGLLDELHIRGAFVLGHGLGAYVAQQLVLDRPDLVSKLVLAAGSLGDPSATLTTPEAEALLAQYPGDSEELAEQQIALSTAAGFGAAQPELFEELVEYQSSGAVSAEAHQAQWAALAAMTDEEHSFAERLGDLAVPTLILFGEQDRVVAPANGDLLAARMPNARVAMVAGAGHLLALEAPEATAALLTDFFGGQRYPLVQESV